MATNNPEPLSGRLERRFPDGRTETITMTVDEVRSAPNRYTQSECARIRVLYDDGEERRPYRFVTTQHDFVFTVDPETGESNVSF